MVRIVEDKNSTIYRFTLQSSHKVIRVYKLDPNTKKFKKFKIFKDIHTEDIYNFSWLSKEGLINWMRLDYYGDFEIWK